MTKKWYAEQTNPLGKTSPVTFSEHPSKRSTKGEVRANLSNIEKIPEELQHLSNQELWDHFNKPLILRKKNE